MNAPIEMRKGEEIADFLRRLQRRLQIPTQGKMAEALHMSESTYKARLKNPSRLTLEDLWQIERMARRANFEMLMPGVWLHDG